MKQELTPELRLDFIREVFGDRKDVQIEGETKTASINLYDHITVLQEEARTTRTLSEDSAARLRRIGMQIFKISMFLDHIGVFETDDCIDCPIEERLPARISYLKPIYFSGSLFTSPEPAAYPTPWPLLPKAPLPHGRNKLDRKPPTITVTP